MNQIIERGKSLTVDGGVARSKPPGGIFDQSTMFRSLPLILGDSSQ